MKAVIMAGGEGKRLRPLTETIPKPLLPIAGIPTIRRILALLATHGITEAAVTTGYLADKLERALGPTAEGISLTYFREETPLGTAGGVALTKAFIGQEDFVVMSGDALSECDLTAAFQARKEQQALALLLLTRVPTPGEFGVVLLDESGRIRGFSEKPSLSGTFSDTVNTGIYVCSPAIFDEIPAGIPYDFGRDLFPKLLEKGAVLTGLVDHSYWCDIGDTDSYREANLRLTGGANAIGQHCLIPTDGIHRSVLFDGCRIGEGCRITEAILAEGVTVERDAVIGKGSVIGNGSSIGEGAVLAAGTVLPGGSRIPAGALLRADGTSVSRTVAASLLTGSGIVCPVTTMTAALAVSIGRALSLACQRRKIGILQDGETSSHRTVAALLRGIRTAGGEMLLLGEGFEAAAAYAAPANGLTLSLFVGTDRDNLRIAFFDEVGLYPKRDFERAFLLHLTEETPPATEAPQHTASVHSVEEQYLPVLIKNRPRLDGLTITITTDNTASQCLSRALITLGARHGRGGLRFAVSRSGFLLTAEQDGFVADDWHIKALLLRYLIRDRIALPALTPTAILDLCRGRYALYTHCPSGNQEDPTRRMTVTHPALLHAAIAAIELAGLISVSGQSLQQLSLRLPSFAVGLSVFDTADRFRLGILPKLGIPAGDGVISTYAAGSVRIIPSRRGFRLVAEAVSSEQAEELLSLSRKEIERLIKEQH